MRKKLFLLFLITPLLVISWAKIDSSEFENPRKNFNKEKLLIELVSYFMQRGHFSPKNLNNNLSQELHKSFIENIDGQKRYFLRKDIISFNRYKYSLDEQFVNLETTFFDLVYDKYLIRREEVKDIYSELLESPFDFTIDENINVDYKNQEFPTTNFNRKEKWRKQLKFLILNIVHNKLEIEKKKFEKDSNYIMESFESLEKDARKTTLDNLDNYFSFLEDLRKEDWFTSYLNSFISQFDPHSLYFAPDDKEQFDTDMSGKYEGIGARLSKRNEAIKIVDIIPGGPIWKKNSLVVGDQIILVRQETGPAVDVQSMRLDDAINLIKGDAGTKVYLTIKKVDGSIKEIEITRDTVQLEESYLKSALVSKSGKKYGLINLPRFYFDLKNKNGRNASNDMQKEIIRFKEIGISGLVIDLRNNGGGGLETVIDMAGLFIDSGPIVQVKTTSNKEVVYSDNDGKSLWDGSLVILVNELSASSSEILAAAMQDYERAVILGSNQTYGKGSVQNIIDFDRVISNSTYGQLGALKFTREKYYRITGKSTQLEGVKSDVVAPDMYKYIDVGEKDEENPLIWDQINPTKHNKWSGYENYAEVIQKSRNRVSENKIFELVDENAKWINAQQNKFDFSLNLNQFSINSDYDNSSIKKFEEIDDYINTLVISSLPYEKIKIKNDTVLASKRNRWKNSLKKDIYLNEAINILEELKLNFIGENKLISFN